MDDVTFPQLIDGLSVPMATTTADGRVELANKHFLDYLGMSLDELRNWETSGAVHPEELAQVLSGWKQSLDRGEPYELDLRVRRADGIYQWVHVRCLPLRDEAGRIRRWCVLLTDIAERKRAETLLDGEKRLLEMIASGSPLESVLEAMCTLVDAVVGDSACSLLLIGRDGKFRHGAGPTLPPGYDAAVNGAQVVCEAGPCGTAASLNEQVIVPDLVAEPRWNGLAWRTLVLEHGLRSVCSTPIVSLTGKVLGTFAIYRRQPEPVSALLKDLIARLTHIASIAMDRTISERDLRERERESRMIVDTIPGLVATLTPAGEVEAVNQQVLAYCGRTLEELKQWGTSDTVHPDDLPRAIQIISEAMVSGDPYEIVERLRRYDGVYRWFQVRGFPLRDSEGRTVRWYVLLTDIEDLKRAEEALHESERESRLIVDRIPGIVGTYSPSGEIELLNQRMLEYFGRSLEEMRHWGENDSFHPDDLPRVIQLFTHALERQEPLEYEARLRRFDGVYRWFQVRAFPARDSTGRVARWYTLVTDIDDRKRAEDALRRSERGLRLIVDTIPALVWCATAEGELEYLNRRAVEYLGHTVQSLTGGRWLDLVHPDHRDATAQRWLQSARTGSSYEDIYRLRRADGEYRWIRSLGEPFHDADGRIANWYGLVVDIEDRKRAETELRRAYDSFSDAQRLSHTGSFITDLVGDDHNWSDETYRIFDFEPGSKVTLQRIAAIIHPDDRPSFESMIARALSGDDVHFSFRIVTTQAAVKHVRGVAHVVEKIEGRPMFVGALQDVTDSRVAEEDLDRARSELAHVARVSAVSALTASIAHEVNQPLSGIITNAGTCLRMLAADPPDVDGARETAKRTLRDGNRAADVITRLRALFSKREFTLELLDMNDVAREVVALSLGDLQRRRIALQTEFAADLPAITGDRIQLQQVILNLLRNASDAMASVNERPRHLLIRTELDADRQVRVTVRDAGVGLDAQSMNKLFDAFFTTKTEGMGIGLSVSRSIIERHHGRLWAESNEGPGATFSFAIPAAAEPFRPIDTKV